HRRGRVWLSGHWLAALLGDWWLGLLRDLRYRLHGDPGDRSRYVAHRPDLPVARSAHLVSERLEWRRCRPPRRRFPSGFGAAERGCSRFSPIVAATQPCRLAWGSSYS